jgi:hypothetical protein
MKHGLLLVEATGASLTITTPTGSIIANTPLAVSGTVAPSGAPVQVALGSSVAVAPTTGFVDATVSGVTWTAVVTPSAAGTYYAWATSGSAAPKASGPITVGAGQAGTNALTINQPSGSLFANAPLVLGGTVFPFTDVVSFRLDTQGTTLPTTGFTTTTASGGAWSGTVTPTAAGTYFGWAKSVATGLSANTGAITVGAAGTATSLSANLQTINGDLTTKANPVIMTWAGFAAGQVPSGQIATLINPDTSAPVSSLQQSESTYHPDGSLKHAIFAYPSPHTYAANGSAGDRKTLTWGRTAGAPLTGTTAQQATALANFKAAADTMMLYWTPPFDYTYARAADYHASFKDIINNGPLWDPTNKWGGTYPIRGWEWICGGTNVWGIRAWTHLRTGPTAGTGNFHRHWKVHFYIYSFNNGSPPYSVVTLNESWKANGPTQNALATVGTTDPRGEAMFCHAQLKYGNLVMRHHGGPFDESGHQIMDIASYDPTRAYWTGWAGDNATLWLTRQHCIPFCFVPQPGAVLPGGMEPNLPYWITLAELFTTPFVPAWVACRYRMAAGMNAPGLYGCKSSTGREGGALKAWAAGEAVTKPVYGGGSLRLANGAIWRCLTDGNCGNTAPNYTGNPVVSDGAISWGVVTMVGKTTGTGTVWVCPSMSLHPLQSWVGLTPDAQPVWIDGGTTSQTARNRILIGHDLNQLWRCGAAPQYSNEVAATAPPKTHLWNGLGNRWQYSYDKFHPGQHMPTATNNGDAFYPDQGGDDIGEDRVGMNNNTSVWAWMRPDQPNLDQLQKTFAANYGDIVPSFIDEKWGTTINLTNIAQPSVGDPYPQYKGHVDYNPVTPTNYADHSNLSQRYAVVFSGSHYSEFYVGPYTRTGHRIWLDLNWASYVGSHVGQGYTDGGAGYLGGRSKGFQTATNPIPSPVMGPNGRDYWGISDPDMDMLRTSSWNMRSLFNVDWLVPETHWQKPYIRALADQQRAFMNDLYKHGTAAPMKVIGGPPMADIWTQVANNDSLIGWGAAPAFVVKILQQVYWIAMHCLQCQRDRCSGNANGIWEQWIEHHRRFMIDGHDSDIPGNENILWMLVGEGTTMAPPGGHWSQDPAARCFPGYPIAELIANGGGAAYPTSIWTSWGQRKAYFTQAAFNEGGFLPATLPSTGFLYDGLAVGSQRGGKTFPGGWDPRAVIDYGVIKLGVMALLQNLGVAKAGTIRDRAIARIQQQQGAGNTVNTVVVWGSVNGVYTDLGFGVQGPIFSPKWAYGVAPGA